MPGVLEAAGEFRLLRGDELLDLVVHGPATVRERQNRDTGHGSPPGRRLLCGGQLIIRGFERRQLAPLSAERAWCCAVPDLAVIGDLARDLIGGGQRAGDCKARRANDASVELDRLAVGDQSEPAAHRSSMDAARVRGETEFSQSLGDRELPR
jgi:hypothetical protein